MTVQGGGPSFKKGGGGGFLRQEEFTLDVQDDLKPLFDSHKVVLSAPGDGKGILLHGLYISYQYISGTAWNRRDRGSDVAFVLANEEDLATQTSRISFSSTRDPDEVAPVEEILRMDAWRFFFAESYTYHQYFTSSSAYVGAALVFSVVPNFTYRLPGGTDPIPTLEAKVTYNVRYEIVKINEPTLEREAS